MNRREWNLALSRTLQSVKAGNKSLVAARHWWNRSVCAAVSQITQGIAVPGTICRHSHKFKCLLPHSHFSAGIFCSNKTAPCFGSIFCHCHKFMYCCCTVKSVQGYFATTELLLVIPFSVTATELSVAAEQSFLCKSILQQQNCL